MYFPSIADMLKDPSYKIETLDIPAAGISGMLYLRRRSETWHFAVVREQARRIPRGMVLLRPDGKSGFSGIYFPRANCGAPYTDVKETAEALHAAGWKLPADDIFELLRLYPAVQVSNLHTSEPVLEAI